MLFLIMYLYLAKFTLLNINLTHICSDFGGGYNNSRHQRDGNTHDDRLSKKWDERQGSGDFNGENVDWSKPTAEDENMKQKLFSGRFELIFKNLQYQKVKVLNIIPKYFL